MGLEGGFLCAAVILYLDWLCHSSFIFRHCFFIAQKIFKTFTGTALISNATNCRSEHINKSFQKILGVIRALGNDPPLFYCSIKKKLHSAAIIVSLLSK